MKMILLALAMAVNLAAADKFRVVYDRTVASDVVVIQQPSQNARGVQVGKMTVFCDGGCTVTVFRDGPTAVCATPSTCELTPIPVITSSTVPRFKVYYGTYATTGAVKIGVTKFSGYMPFDVEDMKMTRNGSNVNYYLVLESATGGSINMAVNATVVQE